MKQLLVYSLVATLMVAPCLQSQSQLMAANSPDRSSSGRGDKHNKEDKRSHKSSSSRESVSSGRSSYQGPSSNGRSSHSSRESGHYSSGRSSSNHSHYTTSSRNPSIKVYTNRHNYHSHVTHLPAHAVRYSYHGSHYYCHNGVYYRPCQGRYVICRPPVGAVIAQTLVATALVAVTVSAINSANRTSATYYYDDGTFYEKSGRDYRVIDPPVGAVVEALPYQYEEMVIDNRTYYKVEDTYYKPSS